MDEDSKEYNKKILNAMDELVEKGPWQKTMFLQVVGKKLDAIRQRFREAMNLKPKTTESQTGAPSTAEAIAKTSVSGLKEVYVSLYNAKGADINRWEKVLHNLNRQIASRPIFSAEKDVQELIRSKINKKNEAYIAVNINKTDLLKPPGGIVPVDPLGHELLVVREGAIQMQNVFRFIHESGRYRLENGRLIREGDAQGYT